MTRTSSNSPPRNALSPTQSPAYSSSMKSPTEKLKPQSKLLPIFTTVPNELRLKELMDLQSRKLNGNPAPGAYEPCIPATKKHFRRPQDASLDGPFLPSPSSDSKASKTTREKEIEFTMKLGIPDSGLSPGQYDAHLSKEFCEKSAPAIKIGSSSREGKVKHAKALSISRSIQHGIDYHATVILIPTSKQSVSNASTSPRSLNHTSERPALPLQEGEFAYTQGQPSPSAPLAKAPPAPAAVARSIKKELESSPGEWDWQKLGHNYRANFTSAGGGAYSKGDRSTARRDLRGAVDSLDLLPKLGMDPSYLPQPTRDTLAGPQGDVSIQRDDAYGTRTPKMGLDSRGGGGLGPLGDEGDWSMPPTPAVPDLTYSPNKGSRVDQSLSAPVEPGFLLSDSELRRREEAARAIYAIQAINERRAAWDQKKALLGPV